MGKEHEFTNSTDQYQWLKEKEMMPGVARKKSSFSLGTFAKFGFPLTVIFGLAAVMTLFNSETEKLNRRTAKLQSDIHALDRDIANLNIKHEGLMGRFILRQVANFKLDLRSPRPGQIKKVQEKKAVVRRSEADPETLMISQR